MKLNETLENLRESYQGQQLDIESCDPDPEKQFDLWLEHAIDSKCDEPNAFVLSSVDKHHRPHARVVLLKGIHQGEFVFFTNYDSAKGIEVNENNHVAITFIWLPLARQVRIEGTIKKIAADKSVEYFHKRPRGSQIGAIASPQSKKLSSRAELEKLFSEVEERYKNQEVLPMPQHWGGYGILPSYFEFWQGRQNRLHDRISYKKIDGHWQRARLAP